MKNKRCKIICFLIIVVLIFTGCGKEKTSDIVEKEEFSLNKELSTTYAFSITSNNELVARRKEKSDFKLLENTEDIKGFDYNYGNLYVYENNEIYSIDLTKGNGKYVKKAIYEFTLDKDNYESDFYVYKNKVIYVNDLKNLDILDLNTKEVTTIANGKNICGVAIDKENGKLYYGLNILNMNYIIYSYDLNTSEEIKLIEYKNDNYYGIELRTYNNGKLVYSIGNKNTYDYETVIYDVSSKKKKVYDIFGSDAFYIENNLYFLDDEQQELDIKNYIKTMDNSGNIKNIYGPTYDSIRMYNIGNNEICYSITEGQDINSLTTYYIYNTSDKKSKEIGTGYLKTKVVNKYDNIKEDKFEDEKIEYSKEDIVGEWTANSTSDSTYSIGLVFGSSLKYGNTLTLRDNNEYTLYIGVAYSESGKYKIEKDKLLLYDIKSDIDESRVKDELLIKRKSDKINLWHKEDLGTEYLYSIFEKKSERE